MVVSVDQFLTLAKGLVRQVSPLILKAVAAESRFPTTKLDGSLVTATDHAVEDLFTQEFSRGFPGIPVLGEERASSDSEGSQRSAAECYDAFMKMPQHIVMDPIDGTKNFVEGRPQFCVAVALTKRVNGGIWPHVGVVAVPVAGIMYWCDETDVFCETIKGGDISKVTRGIAKETRISVNSKDRGWVCDEHFELCHPWISSGSSVNDFLSTALGDLHGSVVCAQRLWDLMAPLALAERLGCDLKDLVTGEVLNRIAPEDLSPELSKRPWGFMRRMVLMPKGLSASELIRKGRG